MNDSYISCLANGRVNDVWSSTNGISWIQLTNAASWIGRYWHTSVVLNNNIILMGGRYSVSSKYITMFKSFSFFIDNL